MSAGSGSGDAGAAVLLRGAAAAAVSAAALTVLSRLVLSRRARDDGGSTQQKKSAGAFPALVVASAPGKVILFGEHAVVYGRTAVAGALGLRTWAVVRRNPVAQGVGRGGSGGVDGFRAEVRTSVCLHDIGIKASFSTTDLERIEHVLASPDSNEIDLAYSTGSGEAQNSVTESAQACVDFLSNARTSILGGRCVSVEFPERFLDCLREEAVKRCVSLDPSNPVADLSSSVVSGVAAFVFMALALGLQHSHTRSDQFGGAEFFEVDIRSLLPVGMGLGSSAAYSVALVTALFAAVKIRAAGCTCLNFPDCFCDRQRNFVNDWAFQLEKVIHGNPSGVDNTVSSFGGLVEFARSGRQLVQVNASLSLLLVNTRVPRTTKELVAGVRRRYERNTGAVTHVLDEMQAIADRGLDILRHASSAADVPFAELGTMIDRNHELLCDLGVGHVSLDVVCDSAGRFGFNAKLTGAGGGGCALVLVKPGQDPQPLEAELRHLGCDVFTAELGCHGASLHQATDLPWPLHQSKHL